IGRRPHTQGSEKCQQSQSRNPENQNDRATVDCRHAKRLVVLALRLFQEEADGNRNHRKNTRCNKCNSAPKRGGQQKSDQSFVGITGADFFQRHELFTDGFQICFVFAHGGGRWGDGWSFGLWYGDRHDWWTTLRIASAGTWVSRRRLWSA